MSIARKLLMSSGGKKDSTFVDDVFSTYLYKGTNGANTVNTGLDMSGEGGLLWLKARSNRSHQWFDTERGVNTRMQSDGVGASVADSGMNQTFTSTGFTFNNTYTDLNDHNVNYTSWNFRKAPGFFDIVKWNGDGSSSNRQIAHNLGSIPGMIIMKAYTHPSGVGNTDWQIYHRGLNGGVNPEQYALMFSTGAEGNRDWFGDTAPTATHFTIGSGQDRNGTGGQYVAYVFAGGESTAATAKSVKFDGNGDDLTINNNTDIQLGSTSAWTVEFWFKRTGSYQDYDVILGKGDGTGSYEWFVEGFSDGSVDFLWSSSGGNLQSGRYEMIDYQTTDIWYHVAIVRNGTSFKVYINGTETYSTTAFNIFAGNGKLNIGGYAGASGQDPAVVISNLRIVKGTALYTSSFKPPTEPLTNITNTKLLCCNNSSTTGSTVTTGTITANGNPTASTDSPFDDPEGFKFGEGGDQNIIKTGSYVGSGSAGLEVNVGFEPQWIIFKNASAAYNWYVLDVMRGIVSNGDEAILSANTNSAEFDSSYIDVTPTGFKLQTNHALGNGSGNTYVYMALRTPDGYVGKPAEAGTDVFAMDVGSNNFPAFDSNFPVDFVLQKAPDAAANWLVPSRLTGSAKYLKTNTTDAEASWDVFDFDSNVGWGKASTWASATNNAWMWKRHAGFDVVTYKGTQTVQNISHSMNKAPEMMWIKNRDSGVYNWSVFHSGLGDNRFKLYLNTTQDYTNDQAAWNNTAPTSTHFTLGIDATANKSGDDYIAMLFASVDGISKVGSYDGTGSTQTITTGFSPRFIIIKRSNSSENWLVFDTTRGWGSGNDASLKLNASDAQGSFDVGAPTSTGFTLVSNYNTTNASGGKYIYYAHA
jgi:hypothetical protein